ncbi:MAG: isoleucine--tRNA ligase [Planctomycetota bacterium]|nr:isoleucine--tRNA ligase [Planctomycetota bacterium]
MTTSWDAGDAVAIRPGSRGLALGRVMPLTIASIMSETKPNYRATLNLPQTPFAMKANLVQNEPTSVKRWAGMGLYRRIRDVRAGQPKFIFHDGPPYANNPLHLGHLMNKSLKDFVVRSKTMQGLDCAYIPGWDCHGLPIEHKVMTDLIAAGKADKINSLPSEQRHMAIRRECQKHAEKYNKHHTQQLLRLLTLGDYEHPYLTMHPSYEGAVLEVLADLVEQGLVYRALKPVHWSIANETALAEAELEYMDREDLSVYVDFEALDRDAVYAAFGLPNDALSLEDGGDEEMLDGADDEADAAAASGEGTGNDSPRIPLPGVKPLQTPCFMIWTTTPWTLPANLAIAVNPKFEYALAWIDGNITVLAADAVERVCKAAKSEQFKILATTRGEALIGLRYRHPFVDTARGEGAGSASNAIFRIVAADYVTLEDGTGLVHTAPGHGTEDYQTGLRENLPVYSPVQANGTYDATVPAWLRGVDVWKANLLVVDRLRDSGHLFFHHTFSHSYPHDWRSKTPTIFRCTEQWFIGVDVPMKRRAADIGDHVPVSTLRAAALHAIDANVNARVAFVPEWGRNRMRGMLESRPDWCISRQRSWGLAIPAFFLTSEQGAVCLLTAASTRAVARIFREKGSDAWFQSGPGELLKHYDLAADPDAPPAFRAIAASNGAWREALTKGSDILDVWFESGSSWCAVMKERGLAFTKPDASDAVELYLEGSDQHRGWFQASMLPGLGSVGRAPYKALLTHGFINDKDGKKLSKSRPDAKDYEIDNLFTAFGADVMRWWVSSLSYENDVKADTAFFAKFGESYVKVRNTIRFMLSNLYDFDPVRGADGSPTLDPAAFPPGSLDAWALAEFDKLAARVVDAYNAYDFAAAHESLYDFCNTTLSAVYLAAIKDRLYCDKAGSLRRRRTQLALFSIADGLCRLLAPLLPHTADEAYRALLRVEASDQTACVHLQRFTSFGVRCDPRFVEVLELRNLALAALERAKQTMSTRTVEIDAKTGTEKIKIQFDALDFGLELPNKGGVLDRFEVEDLADLMGVSQVRLASADAEVRVFDLRGQPQCERSWKRDGTVKRRTDGGLLTDRDADAVGVA